MGTGIVKTQSNWIKHHDEELNEEINDYPGDE
jgi:hypothetical protein